MIKLYVKAKNNKIINDNDWLECAFYEDDQKVEAENILNWYKTVNPWNEYKLEYDEKKTKNYVWILYSVNYNNNQTTIRNVYSSEEKAIERKKLLKNVYSNFYIVQMELE